jgi:tRNA(fMet)-specific endonuclease VapC
MALRYLLDTDTCIYAMNRMPLVRKRLEAAAGSVAMSSVTLGELSFGVRKSQRYDENRRLLLGFQHLVPVLPFDAEAANHFGEVKAHLLGIGRPSGPYDMQIGAHARSLGLTLVTNNTREFDRIPGLDVENWVA